MKSETEREKIEQAYREIEKYRDKVEKDYYRLQYHLMPPVGLMNDPNGLIHWNGVYHVFYQWMPFHTGHGAKFWGHYTSCDLIHWKQEKIALAPSEWYDKDGCYSGSAIDHDGVLTLFYTGNVKDEHGNRQTYQCMAMSKNGIDFEKKGIVVTLPDGYTAHFRDPKVWKKGDKWYMIVGAQSESLDGKAVLFRSQNLRDWEHLGPITGGNSRQLGKFGYMWECPDLFELDGQEVLIVCPQGLEAEAMRYQNVHQSGYFVGRLDYETAQFLHGPFAELDRGFEFYAPQTMLDAKGRRILIAWMGVPDQDEDKHPTITHRWVHALTLPRELKLKDGKLYQTPVEELQMLRKDKIAYSNVTIANEEMILEGISGDVIELNLENIRLSGGIMEIAIRNTARIIYHSDERVLTLERKSFANGLTEKRQCRLERLHSLHMFLDTSSMEVFVNKGEEVFTARFFPYKHNQTISFAANGHLVFDIQKWSL
ncbi:sucrose-6-phosphate hydrolase [Parageobacillus genomosp. 1]|uniref:Sucrose-6-phosphate hydrolase n=1 Tax=Parageobacillus genomosp. 1 TaxID=1295642 RepID=A0ABC9VB69_9BACL|nr:sucrose-6-phosphate hydrolase [Parageobacillus genomosp. 1]EZP75385.1 sucrose-6-phosphate hydrolase [Parageobacillus genomosp. 1]